MPDPLLEARRKLVTSLVLFGVLLSFGTFGFYIVDRLDSADDARPLIDCFYFTLVVLTTVGMSGPESPEERYFSIILMMVGIFVLAAAASNLVAFAVDGELNLYLSRRKLERMIQNLAGHYIVVGFGRMGRALCEDLQAHGESFVLIERDPDLAADAQRHGYLTVIGDATEEETLEHAGIGSAVGLTTCLPDDPANVFVTLTARGLRPQMEIVARAENPHTEPKLRRAGADRVICPPVLSAARVVEMLIKPAVVDLIPATSSLADQLDFTKVCAAKLPRLIGKSLAEADITGRTGMIVAAICRGDKQQFNPPQTTRIDIEAELVVVGPNGGIEVMLDIYGNGEEAE